MQMPYEKWEMPLMPCLTGVTLMACMAGCTTVAVMTPDGQRIVRTKQEFGEYVETVFRYQNRVTDNLITFYAMSDDPDPMPEPAILAAEESMVNACQHVNAIVMAYVEGRTVRLRQQLALVNSITRCEYAARDLDSLVNALENTAVADVQPHP